MSAAECCTICCEALNRTTRRPVTCPFCPYSACTSCVQKFLLTVDGPECMTCRRPWNPDMIDASPLPRSFVLGDLKKHREHVLLERERALLPATQGAVRREDERKVLAKHIATLRHELDASKRRLDVLRWRENRLRRGIEDADADADDGDGGGPSKEKEKRAFVRPCPAENCRGFLTSAFRCGLCDVKVCPKCHVAVGQDPRQQQHACDPSVVESVRAIKKDCRPCPKCGAMIHRIEGCNQMFCTAPGCNTAFDWASLKVLNTRHVHNPHLFEYQRRLALSSGEPSAGPPAVILLPDCHAGPNFPTVAELTRAVSVRCDRNRRRVSTSKIGGEVLQLLRFAIHMHEHEMTLYPAAPDVIDPTVNEDIRKRFLRGDIDEAKLSKMLQAREKARRRRDAIHQILSTFVEVVADLLRSVVAAPSWGRVEACESAVLQAVGVADYTNEALVAVAKRYSCKAPSIKRTEMPGEGDDTRWWIGNKTS